MEPQSTDRGPSSRAKANLLHPTMVNPVAERALKSHGVSTLPRTGFPPPSLLPKDSPHCGMTAPSVGQYSRAWDLWEVGQARVKGNGEKTFTEAQVPLECTGAWHSAAAFWPFLVTTTSKPPPAGNFKLKRHWGWKGLQTLTIGQRWFIE